jgi:hypothetical protein
VSLGLDALEGDARGRSVIVLKALGVVLAIDILARREHPILSHHDLGIAPSFLADLLLTAKDQVQELGLCETCIFGQNLRINEGRAWMLSPVSFLSKMRTYERRVGKSKSAARRAASQEQKHKELRETRGEFERLENDVKKVKLGKCSCCWATNSVAGLAMIDQKNSIEATTPIVTAFKFCIRHRKYGLLNRLPSEVRFLCF